MSWTKPIITEIAVGLEINAYCSATQQSDGNSINNLSVSITIVNNYNKLITTLSGCLVLYISVQRPPEKALRQTL